MTQAHGIRELLGEKRMLIVCGTGGVGKTSISIALGIAGARLGRRVGLITIDPARRLADALGLTRLDSRPKRLNDLLAKETGEKLAGTLAAMMYDPKDTLDRFVETTGGAELLSRMRANNIYQVLAESFSGAHDFLALQKLHELETSGDYDLIVLDTPPARHTLDFLDAPARIAAFFDDRIFQWFLTEPRTEGLFERLRARGTQGALKLLEKITGEGVIRDFARLAPHLLTLKRAFVARQTEIQAVLTSEAAAALFVATGATLPQRDFHAFWQDATRRELQPAALIVNRSLRDRIPVPLAELGPEAKRADPLFLENYKRVESLVRAEVDHIRAMRAELGMQYPFVRVPELGQNIQRIQALLEMSVRLVEREKDTFAEI